MNAKMKLPIAIAALTTLVNGHAASNGTTNHCIATWRLQEEVRESTIIPAFEAKNPGITVTYSPSDSSEAYYDEIPELLSNGTACDVIVARPFDFSLGLFNEGYLEDVTDMAVLDNSQMLPRQRGKLTTHQRPLLSRWHRSLLDSSTTRMRLKR